jgi:hypothetical protein
MEEGWEGGRIRRKKNKLKKGTRQTRLFQETKANKRLSFCLNRLICSQFRDHFFCESAVCTP